MKLTKNFIQPIAGAMLCIFFIFLWRKKCPEWRRNGSRICRNDITARFDGVV